MRYALLLAALVVLAACQATVETQTDQDTDVQQGQAVPGEDPGVDQEVEVEADADIEIETPATKAISDVFGDAAAEYTVTYDMTSRTDGLTSDGEMRMYADLPGKLRSDVETQGMEARTYVLEGTVTTCTDAAGSWYCFANPQAEAPQDAQAQAEAQGDLDAWTYEGTEVIAGVSAECYAYEGEENAQAQFCFSPEGVPLRIVTEIAGESRTQLEATSYSTSTSAADFELPA